MSKLDKEGVKSYLTEISHMLRSSHPISANNSLKLIDALMNIKAQDSLTHMSFSHLSSIASLDLDKKELIKAVLNLAMPSINVLNSKLFIIDENGEYVELNKAEATEQMDQGFLLNPLTGQLVDRFENEVFPLFELSDSFQSMKKLWYSNE